MASSLIPQPKTYLGTTNALHDHEAIRRLQSRIEEPSQIFNKNTKEPRRPDRDIIDTINNSFKGLEKRFSLRVSEGPTPTPKATTWAGVAAHVMQTSRESSGPRGSQQ
jgi:hypothetical protein